MLTGLKRFILWDYARGSLQYDLMVVLILAFIFVTPREMFKDQPSATNIVMLPTDGNDHQFWIGRSTVEGIPEDMRMQRISDMLHQKMERKQKLYELTPVQEDDTIKGYIAHTRPE